MSISQIIRRNALKGLLVITVPLLVVSGVFVSTANAAGATLNVYSADLSTTLSTESDAVATATIDSGIVTLTAEKFSTDDWTASEARITIDASDVGINTLSDLETITWDANVISGYIPHVDVIIQVDGSEDALVFEAAKVDPNVCESQPYPPGEQNTLGTGTIEDGAYAWLNSGNPGPGCVLDTDAGFYTHTLSDWKSGPAASDANSKTISGSTPILRFELEVDPWIADSQAEVSNIVINGVSYHLSIQDAIDAAISGDTVNVAAGMYAENLSINMPVTLQSTSGAGSTIISGTGNVVTIGSDDVTINGFTVTNGNTHGMGIYAIDRSNLTITNNIVTNIGNSDNDVMGRGIVIVSSVSPVDSINISNNQINNITSGMRTGSVSVSASGVSVGWSTGIQDITGLVLSGNTIENINADISPWTPTTKGQGANGILINHASGKSGNTGRTVSPQITNNTISNLEGLWVHAIGLEGDTPSAAVTGNTISNLIDHKTPSDAVAFQFEDNQSAGSVMLTGNTIDPATVAWGVQNVVVGQIVDASQNIGIQGAVNKVTGKGAVKVTSSGVPAVNTLNVVAPGWDLPVDTSANVTACAATPADYCYGVNVFSTIQSAIDVATAGDTINVAAGTYNEAVTIDKSVTLVGDVGDSSAGPGSSAPLLDGQSALHDAFTISAGVSDVAIKGFDIANYVGPGSGVGNAVQAWNSGTSNIEISDNYMHNLDWNGVLVGNDGALGDHTNWTIKNNIVENYTAYGLELTNASNSSFEGNVIHASNSWTSILVVARRNETGITIKNNLIDGYIDDVGTSGRAAIYILGWGHETPGAQLETVLVENNRISVTGTKPHIRVREVQTGIVTGVVVNSNNLSILENLAVAEVNAANNWWGTTDQPTIAGLVYGEVNFEPYCATSACTSIYATVSATGSQLDGVAIGIDTSTGATATSTPAVTILAETPITAGTSTVTLPAEVVITRAGGGNLDATALSASAADLGSLGGLGTGVITAGALQWGIPSLGLEFSAPISLSIYVGDEYNGQVLNIIRSISGTGDWTSDGISPNTCTVASGLCEFTATKASYFATGQFLNVTTDSASNAISSSANFNGTIAITSGGSNATERGFEYGPSTSYGKIVKETGSFGAGAFSLGASGLACQSEHYFRAYAINDTGTVYGSEVKFMAGTCPSTGGGGGGGGGGGAPAATTPAPTVATTPTVTTATPTATPTVTPPAGEVLGVATFRFAQVLRYGSEGNDVTELQNRLTSEGVYTGPITGYFGPLTEAGVNRYQAKYNIDQVGIVGPITRAQLNSAVAVTVPQGQVAGAFTSNLTESQIQSILGLLVVFDVDQATIDIVNAALRGQ